MISVDSLIWLRRDLRLYDHKVWNQILENSNSLCPVFIFDQDILADFPDTNDRRISFIANSLELLNKELNKFGGEVIILHGKSYDLIPQVANILEVKQVYAGADYEPKTIQRDREVSEVLINHGIKFNLSIDHIIFAPREVMKPDKTPYHVFTPYSRAWLKKLKPENYQDYKVNLSSDKFASVDEIKAKLHKHNIKTLSPIAKQMVKEIGYEYIEDDLWQPASALDRLEGFCKNYLSNYENMRNIVSEDATSKISPYLRFGLLSIRHIYREAFKYEHGERFILELIWREFFIVSLYFYPDSVNAEFKANLRELKWNYDPELIKRVENGLTGFPIVDAAMRQLKEQGWIHNRARMVAASFISKNLGIDWRVGEKIFAKYLMDYELALNVGNWQWAASTGFDAQPYFRMFNPFLQSKKFDPKAIYIKRFIKELENLPIAQIHMPLERPINNYPIPIINFSESSKQAINRFKNL